MTTYTIHAEPHLPRQQVARIEAREALVDLLVGHVAQAYVTAGQPGMLNTVRNLFRRMEPAALTALVYQMGLVPEPTREEEPEERR